MTTSMTPLRRSKAAVEQLEHLQSQEAYRSGDERKPGDDSRVLREIAERQLLAEYLASHDFASVEAMTQATSGVVGEPSFQAAVEQRAGQIEGSFQVEDGDIWPRYERPDRRKRLSELVVRVEEAAGKRGLRIPRRPAVGTLPTYDINAQAIPGPPGEGHIIVFESGIFSFSGSLGKLAAQAIDAKLSGSGSSLLFHATPPPIIDHIGRHSQILLQFYDFLFSQAVLGTSVYIDIVPLPPQNAPVANQLIDSIDTFVLAHEYGHVILGHTGVHGSGKSGHEQELEADALGLDLCTAAWNGELWAYSGASVFLSGLDVVDRAAATFLTGSPEPKPSASHPAAAERRAALSAVLRRAADPNVCEGAMRMADAIDWALHQMTELARPGFEKAYRKGYPHAGFRPRDEYEKRASLYAFMAEGFGSGGS
ncbi:MAG TPA: hypothetical protein VNN08_03750 [Thermoanaerobaculia bacterium]|nr:hypothetical protein [Thermoanaerobaculia bacterium]